MPLAQPSLSPCAREEAAARLAVRCRFLSRATDTLVLSLLLRVRSPHPRFFSFRFIIMLCGVLINSNEKHLKTNLKTLNDQATLAQNSLLIIFLYIMHSWPVSWGLQSSRLSSHSPQSIYRSIVLSIYSSIYSTVALIPYGQIATYYFMWVK